MTESQFKESINQNKPLLNLSKTELAIWYAKKENWEASHEIAQSISTKYGCWLHAILHRWEGDHANAKYWYRQAKVQFATTPIQQELDLLIKEFYKHH